MRMKNQPRRLYCSAKMENLYDLESQIDYEKRNELNVNRIPNGIVHPLKVSANGVTSLEGGVTDSDIVFVPLCLTKRIPPKNIPLHFEDWFGGVTTDIDIDSIKYVDEDVVFLGAMSGHYGHFIMEGLSRLWYFLDPKHSHLKAVYISEVMNNRFIGLFSLFGLQDTDITEVSETTQFRNVFVPEQSIRLHDYYHPLYRKTIERIKKNVKSGGAKKVFFSKRLCKSGRAIGEGVIESIFKKNGYVVFNPEKLTLYETISILKGCDCFVASSGTNIHNSIFIGDNKTTVCLNRSEHFHPIQIMIDRMKGLQSSYIDIFLFSSDAMFGNLPCFVVVTKFLRKYLAVTGMTFSVIQSHLLSSVFLFEYIYIMIYRRLSLWKSHLKGRLNILVQSLRGA